MKTKTTHYQFTNFILPRLRICLPALVGAALILAESCAGAIGQFVRTGDLTTTFTNQKAALLQDGRVLIAGGSAGHGQQNAAELYDPVTGTWATTGLPQTGRSEHTATTLPNGRVLVTAGFDTHSVALNTAELYDPATASWHFTGSLATGRGRKGVRP